MALRVVAGLKRAGHYAGRAATEAWGSSRTAVKGARTKRQSDSAPSLQALVVAAVASWPPGEVVAVITRPG